jgi:cytidylate kinase
MKNNSFHHSYDSANIDIILTQHYLKHSHLATFLVSKLPTTKIYLILALVIRLYNHAPKNPTIKTTCLN